MKKAVYIIAGCLILALQAFYSGPQKNSPRKITVAKLEDKIRGGWAGQMIGVAYGAPLEFRSNGATIETNLNNYQDWTPKRLLNALKQDDIYVDITFATVIDSLGLNATIDDYGDYFKQSKYLLFHANAQARQNLRQGIPARLAGSPKYNVHANDIDFQIEADFIGTMTPGMPQFANEFCEKIGRIMNYGDGLYGGMFVAGMYAAAFFEDDPYKIVQSGLACIPAQSRYAQVIDDVLKASNKFPSDWKQTWQIIEDKWDVMDVCPGGALEKYNIDASINGAYIAIGLLYGKKDLEQTMQIAARCGQDADCNASSAGGILGTILGYTQLPQKFLNGFENIKKSRFDNTTYSFDDIVASTRKRAFELIKKAGGTIKADKISIPLQEPVAPVLEQFTMGKPEKIITAEDAAWTWKGNWQDRNGVIEWDNEYKGKVGLNGGSMESELSFDGTALLLLGINSEKSGMADVYVDGEKKGTINAYAAKDTFNDALWHIYGLDNSRHTLKIVMLNKADNSSKGTELHILGAVVYR